MNEHVSNPADPPPILRTPPPISKPWDVEDFIGRKVLPAIGAILLLAALGSWAPVAYRSLTPTVAFGLEIAFSILFFGVGRVLKQTKANFGELLSGIGAGSLLITIVAGSQYHHVYGDQAMVALCLGGSFSLVGYGMLLRSRTFEAIGAVGGMLGAWMPSLHHQNLFLSAALQAMIVAATLSVFAKGRWKRGIFILWPISLLALSQFLFATDLDWRWQVAALDLLGLEFALGYAFTLKEGEDRWMPFSVSTLLVSTFGSVLIQFARNGSIHTVDTAIFCGVTAVAALCLFKTQKRMLTLQFVALTCAATIIPWGYSLEQCSVLYAGFSIALALIGVWQGSTPIVGLALYETLLGVLTNGSDNDYFTPQRSCIGLVLLASIVVMQFGSRKAEKRDAVLAGLGVLGWLVVSEIANRRNAPFGNDAALSGAWSVWALLQLGAACAWRVKGLKAFSYGLLGVTIVKVLVNDLNAVDGSIRAVVLLVLGLVMLAGGYIAIRSNSQPSAPN